MMDFQRVADIAGRLAALKFFPADDAARLAIMEMIGDMASNEDQVRWLVKSALAVYNEWPGPRELRALFSSRWTPADGVKAYSLIYPSDENGGGFPDNIYPPTKLPALISPRDMKAIEAAPMHPESQAMIDTAVEVMPPMPKPIYFDDQFEKTLAEVLTPPVDRPLPPAPTPQIITAEDIRRAVEELRAKKQGGV